MSDFKLEDWPVIFAEYETSKATLQAEVAKERSKLDKANDEYTAAVTAASAKSGYDTARARYNAFNRWVESLTDADGNRTVRLTDPTAASVPGVAGTHEEG